MASKSILDEIKQGKNIDLYITLALALGLAVTNIIISMGLDNFREDFLSVK